VALHLARALAEDAATAFVDCDLRWGSATRLGIDASAARTWGDRDAVEGSLHTAALPVPGGFRVLLAPSSGASEDVAGVLRGAAAEFDRVVVDAPFDAILDSALSCADAVVLVVSPTVVGAHRARSFMAERAPEVPWVVVLNRLGPGGETRRAELEHVLQRSVALELPCCAALRDVEDEGRLLGAPWHGWRRGVRRLARALSAPARTR
jgi:Flp pilus assembly CpaE family ATPase